MTDPNFSYVASTLPVTLKTNASHDEETYAFELRDENSYAYGPIVLQSSGNAIKQNGTLELNPSDSVSVNFMTPKDVVYDFSKISTPEDAQSAGVFAG